MAEPVYAGQPDSFVVESVATGPISGRDKRKSWLQRRHKEYDKLHERWKHVEDFYLGEVADPDCARKYIIRRFQGEPDKAYDERVKTSDYTPHLGTLIDTLAGMLFSVEERATRMWTDEKGTKGLGDVAAPGTPANRLFQDADGEGTSWATIWRQFVLDVIVYQRMWVLVDTVDGVPVVKLISPATVTNWLNGPNGPVQVLVKEHLDARTDLSDDPKAECTYLRYLVGGWERWEEDAEGNPNKIEEGQYQYEDRQGRPRLPIYCVKLPMRRYIAWILSRKCQVIFNHESVRDHGLRIANFAKLLLHVASTTQYDDLIKKLKRGDNVLPVDKDAAGSHEYIAPSSEPTTNASAVLEKKVEEFWHSGFKMYADAAAEKTATEVKQDVAAGVGAFLQLLKLAVDDAENQAMHLLEQAEYSESRDKWGTARVERSDDFATVDPGAVLDQMRKRYLGETEAIPVGRQALIELAADAARQDGLTVNKDEIEAAVDAQQMGRLLEQLLNVIPATIKARLTMRLVAAMGLIDPKEMVAMSDGEQQKLFDQLLTQAEELARVQEETARRQAELPAFNPGSGAME
jgi:hypothetical protein